MLKWKPWRHQEVWRRLLQPVVKCRRMKRPQFMSENWEDSWQWKSSRIRQQFYRLESFAMNTGIPMSGSKVKNHISFKMVFEYTTYSSSSTSTSTTPSGQETDHSDHHPAIESSESVDRHARWDPFTSETSEELLHEPTEIPKPNENEDHEHVRGSPYSDIPEWLQEFRENLVDERVPEHRDSHASSSHGLSLEPTSTRREDLGKHSVETRSPKDRNCEICKRTKITRAPRRRRNGETVPRAENFGDLITADHKFLSDNCESRNNHRYAVVVQDLATLSIQAYPCKNKTSQETQRSLHKFLEPERKPEVIHTDNSLEFGKACEDRSWNDCTSTPRRSETNGIAERAVRRVKEGTSAVLLQSGLNENWWADSVECYTNLRNIQDLLSDGKTPYERRFGEPFKGPIIPFGSLVEYYPISAKDQSRIHQFGKKVLLGLFLGYALYAGGNLEGWRTGCRHWGAGNDGRIENLLKKAQCKGSNVSQRKWKLHFPVADGRNKVAGGDQELRTSTLIRDYPIRGEDQRDFLGKSEGSPPSPPQDSYLDADEARNDFWSISGNFIYRHHVEPRVKLYSPREESFPIPLKHIDVSRTTHTNLDVMQEKRIDDYWNIDGSRDLSDPWTGFTQFTLLDEKAPDGYTCPGGDWRENSLHPGQIMYGQNSGRKWERMTSWRRSKSGRMRNSIWRTHENCEGSISLTWRTRSSKKPSRMPVRSWKHQLLVGVVDPTKFKQDLRVFWKLMNPQDCAWEIHHQIIMKTILQEKETIHHSITIWFTNLFLCLKLWKFLQRKQRWTRNGKNWRKFWRGTWRKSEVRNRWSMKQGRQALQFILHH